jgi:hypothetical protein
VVTIDQILSFFQARVFFAAGIGRATLARPIADRRYSSKHGEEIRRAFVRVPRPRSEQQMKRMGESRFVYYPESR